MKKLLLSVCTVLLLAVACDKDNNQQEAVLNGTAVSIQSAVIPPIGGEISFVVTADAPWKVYDKPDWLVLSPSEGKKGTTSVVMSADMNRTYQDRECTLRIETSTGTLSESLPVSQEYPYIELSRQEIDFTWNHCETLESEAEVITLHSNVEWTLTPVLANLVELREEVEQAETAAAQDPTLGADWGQYTAALRNEADELDWLSYSPASGNGDAELLFCPKTYNISREPREMVIRVVGPLDTYELNFSQANLRFIVDKETIDVFEAAHPEPVEVEVDAERPWTLASAPSWIVASPENGVDITTLTICPDGANPTREDRSGQVVLLCEEVVERKIDVAQYGYVFDVTPTSFSLANVDAEPRSLSVTSSGEWEARNVPEWITLSASEGTGGGVAEALTLKAAGQNLELKERSATIEFGSKQNSLTSNVTVTQAAFIFTVTPGETLLPTLSTDHFNLYIACSGPWTASSSAEWLEVSQASGPGNATISYHPKAANTDENPRKATITVTSTLNNITRTVEITQKGYIFTVTPQSYQYPTLPTASQYCQVKIECSADWSITSKPDWITPTMMSGTGDATIELRAENNTLLEQRSGTVTFTSNYNGSNKTIPVEVTQDKFIFLVSPSSFEVPTIVTTPYVATVECSAGWSVSNLPTWIKSSQTTQSGNGSVTFTVESNPELSPRSATVRVNSTLGGHTHDISFSQAAFQFDSSPVSYEYEAVDQTKHTFQVVCSGPWNFTGAPSWVTLSPSSGTGNAQVSVGANNNIETSPREIEFALRSSLNGLERPITIRQKAFVFNVTAQSSYAYEALNSTSNQVSVECMGGWTVQGAEAWMNVSPTSGTDNGTVTIAPANNTEKRTRSGKISIVSTLNPQLKKEITISQAAFEFDETQESYTYEALNPGSTQVQFNGMGNWSVENVPTWAEVSPQSGNGNAQITITPQQNLDIRERSVTLYVTSSLNSALKKPITLTQKAFRFNTTTEQKSYPAINPTQQSVTIECMEGWTVTNTADWVTVSPMSGSNDGSISISVDENLELSPRNTSIRVTSTLNPSLTKTVEISQEAFRFDTSSQTLSFGALDEGSQQVSVSCMGGWSVENSHDSWISVVPTSGSDDGSVSVRVEQNLQTSSRSGSFEIVSTKNPALKRVITVNQSAFEFNSDPVELGFQAAAASSQSVSVVCMGGWDIEDAEAWMNVNPTSGTGNGSITVAPSDNGETTPRSGVIYLVSRLNPDLRKQITITQAAYSFEVSPSTLSLPGEPAAAETVRVSCPGGSWRVECDADWLTFSAESGSGAGSFTVNAASANETATERTAEIRVVCELNNSLTRTITVSQAVKSTDQTNQNQ